MICVDVYRIISSASAETEVIKAKILMCNAIYYSYSFYRWKDNIRMNLEEIGINAGNRVESAQDSDYWTAVVNAASNLRVHKTWS